MRNGYSSYYSNSEWMRGLAGNVRCLNGYAERGRHYDDDYEFEVGGRDHLGSYFNIYIRKYTDRAMVKVRENWKLEIDTYRGSFDFEGHRLPSNALIGEMLTELGLLPVEDD